MIDNLRTIASELKLWFKQAIHRDNFWLWLPGIAGIVLAYAFHGLDLFPTLLQRNFHEGLAIWLLIAVALLLTTSSMRRKDRLLIYLAVLAWIFLLRELDDTAWTLFDRSFELKTKKLVSVLLLGMAWWGVYWQEHLFARLNRALPFKLALTGMVFTYFCSQLIARRAFRHILPMEKLLHIGMEEMTETIAHLFFLTIAIASFRMTGGPSPSEQQPPAETIGSNRK